MSPDEQILRAGDPWDEHYRGTRYHFNPAGEVWWRVPATEAKVKATAGYEAIVEKLLELRPEGGSFRITETGAVITKDQEETADWDPLYVDEYHRTLEFEKVNTDGTPLDPGDLWTAFYDGARYSVKRGELWWRNPEAGLYQRTNESLPEDVMARFEQVKPLGGSFRITENGHVLTLIPPQPMPSHLRPQFEALTNTQKRLIQVKVEGTDMLPVYLGDYLGGFTLQPPERLTDPLSAEEEEDLVGFLKDYDDAVTGRDEAPLYSPDDPEEES